MSDAQTTLLTGIVEETTTERGFNVTSFNMSGEPYAKAIVAAVVSNYHRVTKRPRVTEEDLLARIDEKVTLIQAGENMLGSQAITAIEGRLFVGSRAPIAILPKGKRSKGYVVKPENVLDILGGYATDKASMLVEGVRSQYPELRNLTRDRLLTLPGEDEMGDDEIVCSLAVFGQWRMPDCVSHDALWLIGEYWPDHDICDRSVLLIRPEHGISEHGSVYGEQLLRLNVGEVVGFPGISYRDAVGLCDVDFDEALATVFAQERRVTA